MAVMLTAILAVEISRFNGCAVLTQARCPWYVMFNRSWSANSQCNERRDYALIEKTENIRKSDRERNENHASGIDIVENESVNKTQIRSEKPVVFCVQKQNQSKDHDSSSSKSNTNSNSNTNKENQ